MIEAEFSFVSIVDVVNVTLPVVRDKDEVEGAVCDGVDLGIVVVHSVGVEPEREERLPIIDDTVLVVDVALVRALFAQLVHARFHHLRSLEQRVLHRHAHGVEPPSLRGLGSTTNIARKFSTCSSM